MVFYYYMRKITEAWISVLLPTHCKFVSLVRVEGIARLQAQQMRSLCIAMSLHQDSSSRFSPGPETFLVSGSWSLLQCVWGPSHGVGLEYNQKVVGYSPKVCATIVPIHIAGT